ncbi:MAG TPA: FlgD immunoglobulin-like domain containing protein [bacterium]|jgi:hypothetical protein|nr:FlgD immunoglobulin-like domain containing protein [bacterium]HXB96439.1 FlgD immunoglobulin-like domain containing protein [bacterium]
MKRELLAGYFERDLTVDEEARVAELLRDSPEEALRFAGMAASEYQASGYPEPRPRGRSGGAWLKRGLALGVAAGAGFWLWGLLQAPAQTEARGVSASPAQDSAAPPPSPRPPAPAQAVEAGPTLDVQVLESGRFKLTVDLGGRHRVDLALCDAAGRPLRSFYRGSLDAGRWSFEWDGRLADGSAARPGQPYQVELDAQGHRVRRWLQLERRQMGGINAGEGRP